MPRLGDGLFWMRLWIGFLILVVAWGILTMATPLRNSVANVAALSVVANIGMAAAGVQTTLGMRKADPEDPL